MIAIKALITIVFFGVILRYVWLALMTLLGRARKDVTP